MENSFTFIPMKKHVATKGFCDHPPPLVHLEMHGKNTILIILFFLTIKGNLLIMDHFLHAKRFQQLAGYIARFVLYILLSILLI